MSTTDQMTPPPPPQGDWQAPQQQIVYVKAGSNGLAIAGFVCALVGVLFGMIPILFLGAFLFGVLGVVFSAIGLNKSKRTDGFGQPIGRGKMALAGVILSIVAFVLGGVGVAVTADAVNDIDKAVTEFEQDMADLSSDWDAYENCMDAADDFDAIEACGSLLD